jgi:TM2 domain-containing membrane protein YozV
MTVLTDNQCLILETRFAGERKNLGIAYLLLFFTLVGHNFYLGRIGRGIAQFLLCFLLVGFVWILFDIFTLPGTVQALNDGTRQKMTMELLGAG